MVSKLTDCGQLLSTNFGCTLKINWEKVMRAIIQLARPLKRVSPVLFISIFFLRLCNFCWRYTTLIAYLRVACLSTSFPGPFSLCLGGGGGESGLHAYFLKSLQQTKGRWWVLLNLSKIYVPCWFSVTILLEPSRTFFWVLLIDIIHARIVKYKRKK